MTNREAIERLKSMLCKDEYPNGENSKAFQLDTEAIDIAIEALEKQMPKKFTIARFFNKIEYGCPRCYSVVGEDRYTCKGTKITNVFREHHCTCGQSIDWSYNND